MENSENLYSELDLKLMNVKQLQKLLRDNRLKVPRLKADMVQVLLSNNIQKNGKIRSNFTSSQNQISSLTDIKLGLLESRQDQISSLTNTKSGLPESRQDQISSLTDTKLELLDLPNEKIYEICEELDNKSLTNLVRSNKKLYQICNEILIKRLEEEEFIPPGVKLYYDSFLSKLVFDGDFIDFTNIVSTNIAVGISISKEQNHYNIIQIFFVNAQRIRSGIPTTEIVPWIFPKISYKEEINREKISPRLVALGYKDKVKRRASVKSNFIYNVLDLLIINNYEFSN